MKNLFLALIILTGCSDRDEAWDPSSILPDSGAGDVGPDVRTDFSCQDHLIQEDFYNCGECGNHCNSILTDQCFGGSCSCGEQGPCAEGQRCWKGACYDPDPGEVCETDDDCPTYRKNCIEGRCKTVNCGEFETACPDQHVCIQDQCTAVECVPEVCDGIDNDCDGEVDATNGQPLAEFCYSGPDINNISPPCQKGIRICENAQWSECMNEIPPIPEQGLLGCDGLDNNCDGCVDGIFENNMCVSAKPKSFDIVYVIDVSGSMLNIIDATIEATEKFSATYQNNPAYKFGIVLIPGPLGENSEVNSELYLNLSDFTTFSNSLSNVITNRSRGADEPSWDAVYELATGDIPITWREESTRIIILFTDEEGQTYRQTRGLPSVTETDMCNSLQHGEVLAVVTEDRYAVSFDDCGLIFQLSEDSNVVAEQLSTIITDPCQ